MFTLKRLFKYLKNQYSDINYGAILRCQDDLETVHERNYVDIIDELTASTEIKEKKSIFNKIYKYRYSLEILTINDYECEIMYDKSHYKARIIDDKVSNLSDKSLDYIPYGGFTTKFGFNCSHNTDIMLLAEDKDKTFPHDPNSKYKNKKRTFKTKKFVINELKKIVESIKRTISRKKLCNDIIFSTQIVE